MLNKKDENTLKLSFKLKVTIKSAFTAKYGKLLPTVRVQQLLRWRGTHDWVGIKGNCRHDPSIRPLSIPRLRQQWQSRNWRRNGLQARVFFWSLLLTSRIINRFKWWRTSKTCNGLISKKLVSKVRKSTCSRTKMAKTGLFPFFYHLR